MMSIFNKKKHNTSSMFFPAVNEKEIIKNI